MHVSGLSHTLQSNNPWATTRPLCVGSQMQTPTHSLTSACHGFSTSPVVVDIVPLQVGKELVVLWVLAQLRLPLLIPFHHLDHLRRAHRVLLATPCTIVATVPRWLSAHRTRVNRRNDLGPAHAAPFAEPVPVLVAARLEDLVSAQLDPLPFAPRRVLCLLQRLAFATNEARVLAFRERLEVRRPVMRLLDVVRQDGLNGLNGLLQQLLSSALLREDDPRQATLHHAVLRPRVP